MTTTADSKLSAAIRAELRPRSAIPALLAAGSCLAAVPALALEVGEAQVNSSLGQPLRASVAYTLGPNEALAASCVSVQGGASTSGLPNVTRADINVGNGIISITGNAAIREPLMSMRLNIRCPYTPQLSRDYMLFIDPAQPVTSPVANTPAVSPAAANSPVVATSPAPRRSVAPTTAPSPAVRRRPVVSSPISDVVRYRVQPGDSLSMIASRIENRPIGIWEAVGVLFDANPDAFIDNDPNKLKAGAWLDIPDFGAAASASVAETPIFEPATTAPEAASATTSVESPVSVAETASAAASVSNTDSVSGFEEPADTASAADPAAIDPATFDPAAFEPVESPGNEAVVDSDNPFVTPGNETVIIPDTELEGPETLSSSPNVPVATLQTSATNTSSVSLFAWLIGGAVALLLGGWLLLSRRQRRPLASRPVAAAAPAPQRRATDSDSDTIEEEQYVVETVAPAQDWDVDDDAPTEENLAVDADLLVGTGLTEGNDVDMARDFGFAATTELDMELPEEMSSGDTDLPETDILEPLNADLNTILESEVLPEDGDDDYDMSVIMDATKMPMPEDVTERDIEALEVDTDDDTINDDDYTVSQEVDYKILEQDYEDELTATMALNSELARAAEDLVANRDDAQAYDDDPTSREVSLASVTPLDVTAQMPAKAADEDEDATGEESVTLLLESEDNTVEMPARDDNDDTAEMPFRKRRSR